MSTAETLGARMPQAPQPEDLAEAQAPRLFTEVPGPEARARIERDHKVTSPSLPRAGTSP